MNSDTLTQQMMQEGILHTHFTDSPIHYSSCPYCNDAISQEIFPSLLQCGHIACNQCTPFCGICNTTKNVKIQIFTTLLKYLDLMNKPNVSTILSTKVFYNFSINHINSRAGMVFDQIPESMVVGELLEQMPQFQAFFSRVGRSTSISLGGKNLLYSQVKGKTFKELRNAGVPLKTGLTNYLFYLDRSVGGRLK